MRSRVLILLTCLTLAAFAAGHGQAALLASSASNPAAVSLLSFAPQSVAPTQGTSGLPLKLPLKPKSVRFAVIGDNGTGRSPQFEVAQQMEAYRQVVDFSFVIMLGDNIYGGHSPKDFARKFEQPYKPLLDAGVKFYAALGNHDKQSESHYGPFNMGGERYYSFKKNDVAFFVLDSSYMDPAQLDWLEKQLRDSNATWKICYFHHPLYSDGKAHGPDLDLRSVLVPLFQKYQVNVVFAGHEHFYERLKPQNGIYYFILGNSGQLRFHNIRHSDQTEVGFDTDQGFMLVEVEGDDFYFQTISRTGITVDSGVLHKQPRPSN
jgi:predicted phosphodiesterase